MGEAADAVCCMLEKGASPSLGTAEQRKEGKSLGTVSAEARLKPANSPAAAQAERRLAASTGPAHPAIRQPDPSPPPPPLLP